MVWCQEKKYHDGPYAVICGRGVYSYDLVDKKPVVVKPYNRLIGCQTCANLCPQEIAQ